MSTGEVLKTSVRPEPVEGQEPQSRAEHPKGFPSLLLDQKEAQG